MSGIWDWGFFWEAFEFFLKIAATFLLIVVAIVAVGMLLTVVINAIRGRNNT